MGNNASASKLEINKVISLGQLPGLPQSAIRLLELSQDPSNGPAEFTVPIEADPGLAGQVLKFVNSSYFGFAREISSVKMGITLVGIRTIKNFALWSAVFSLMPNPRCGPFDLRSLWQDSLRRALFARALVKLLGFKEGEEAFAAALLQDMAVPILAKESPLIYAKLLASRKQGHVRLSHLENEVFGWTHAQAAALMARYWNLPDDFAKLIEMHTDIDAIAAQPDQSPDKVAVTLSALLPTVADPIWTEYQSLEVNYDRAVPPGSPKLEELLGRIDGEFEKFAPVMKLATPAKSLLECCHEVASAAV
jgi:HD-like signal output (HDOD) protein